MTRADTYDTPWKDILGAYFQEFKPPRESAKKTAKNLLSLGILTEEQIAQVAELSVEEVRHLKNEAEDSPGGDDSGD